MDPVVLIALGALLLGLYAGANYARFKRSLADVRGTRTLLNAAKKRRVTATVNGFRAMIFLTGAIFVFILGLRAAGKV